MCQLLKIRGPQDRFVNATISQSCTQNLNSKTSTDEMRSVSHDGGFPARVNAERRVGILAAPALIRPQVHGRRHECVWHLAVGNAAGVRGLTPAQSRVGPRGQAAVLTFRSIDIDIYRCRFPNDSKGFQDENVSTGHRSTFVVRDGKRTAGGKRGGGESHQRTVAIGSPGVGGSAGLPQTLSWTKPNGNVALVRPC